MAEENNYRWAVEYGAERNFGSIFGAWGFGLLGYHLAATRMSFSHSPIIPSYHHKLSSVTTQWSMMMTI